MKISATGSMITIEYHEPIVNALNSSGVSTPLTDLDHTTIYMNAVKVRDVPATALTGGGLINETFDSGVGTGQEKDIFVYATAWDISGNEGVQVAFPVIRIDTLAPSAPFEQAVGQDNQMAHSPAPYGYYQLDAAHYQRGWHAVDRSRRV